MLLKGETEAVINSCDAHSLRRIKVLNSCIWDFSVAVWI